MALARVIEATGRCPTTSGKMKMTKTFDLTANETTASMILVKSCLYNMGGKRPSDLDHDPLTWVEAKDLIRAGYSKPEAAGTWGALDAKGMIFEHNPKDWAMTEDGYRYLDTIWDSHNG